MALPKSDCWTLRFLIYKKNTDHYTKVPSSSNILLFYFMDAIGTDKIDEFK